MRNRLSDRIILWVSVLVVTLVSNARDYDYSQNIMCGGDSNFPDGEDFCCEYDEFGECVDMGNLLWWTTPGRVADCDYVYNPPTVHGYYQNKDATTQTVCCYYDYRYIVCGIPGGYDNLCADVERETCSDPSCNLTSVPTEENQGMFATFLRSVL